MKIDENGSPKKALAKDIDISKDKKRYLFTIRDAKWSNGDSITAHDFVHSWRQVLNPDFNTSFAYLFYPIKNARKAKIGEVPIDKIGIKTLNSNVLEVQLDYPCPHFLQLLTLNIFCPINRRIDLEDPHWYFKENNYYICNGTHRPIKQGIDKVILTKNRLYYRNQDVKIESIEISKNPIQMIQQTVKEDYGWISGVPNEEKIVHHQDYQKKTSDQYSTWFRVNVYRYPFNNKNFRKALSYAIDRGKIQEVFPNVESANHFLPSTMAAYQNPAGLFSLTKAKLHLMKAKSQLGIPNNAIIEVELLCPDYYESNFYQIINLIQDQLYQIGIRLEVKLVPIETFFERSLGRHYQLRTTNWAFLIDTPFYLLDTFYSPTHTDLYLWTSKKYQKFYQQWCYEEDPTKRQKIQILLEKTILNEHLVVPLYFENYVGLINKDLMNVHGNAESTLDFSTSYLNNERLTDTPPITWAKRWK